MLAGEPPFSGATLQAVMAAVLTRTPAPLPAGPGVSPQLGSAITKALAKMPNDPLFHRRRLQHGTGEGERENRVRFP